MIGKPPITIYYCDKHREWFSNNCSNCMVDSNELDIRAEVLKEVGEWLQGKGTVMTIYSTMVFNVHLWDIEALKSGTMPPNKEGE